ncbi:MAG: hypothetical protein FJ298_03650 [Planctomycetes bacterium]|nr:hypothetical protein [Planctomycetota bacterium]
MQRSTITLGLLGLALSCAVATNPPGSAQLPSATDGAAAREVAAGTGAFLDAQRCALCHSHSPLARAMTTNGGDDVSPHGTWSATMMANSFRDPYWRAQMAHEVETAPHMRAQIEGLCLRCHAPTESHRARLDRRPPPSIESALASLLAKDGVSCTVCHQAQPENLGTPASFSGRLDIRDEQRIFGPYASPSTGPMRMHTGYTPEHGPHISSSALCGACHTLYTHSEGAERPFLEQAPYLEWRNSVFSDEVERTDESRGCVECHMSDGGSMRIARNPSGRDFNIAIRDNVRSHAMIGGNAFMTDLLRKHRDELRVTASDAALERVASATRAQLAHSTARIDLRNAKREGGVLRFDLAVENLTGHKLPSGYPSRRAWLSVEVRAGNTTLFETGVVDTEGRICGLADELAQPHFDVVSSPEQVVVYEMIALDRHGAPTVSLAEMVEHRKDTRLLPRGWRADGPHADETAPVGTSGDDDFVGGGDVVTYSLALPANADGELLIVARMLYQTIPPAWADGLRDSRTQEARDFLRMYDGMEKLPETLATAALVVPAK